MKIRIHDRNEDKPTDREYVAKIAALLAVAIVSEDWQSAVKRFSRDYDGLLYFSEFDDRAGGATIGIWIDGERFEVRTSLPFELPDVPHRFRVTGLDG